MHERTCNGVGTYYATIALEEQQQKLFYNFGFSFLSLSLSLSGFSLPTGLAADSFAPLIPLSLLVPWLIFLLLLHLYLRLPFLLLLLDLVLFSSCPKCP